MLQCHLILSHSNRPDTSVRVCARYHNMEQSGIISFTFRPVRFKRSKVEMNESNQRFLQ